VRARQVREGERTPEGETVWTLASVSAAVGQAKS
jgi:hypothetical protein